MMAENSTNIFPAFVSTSSRTCTQCQRFDTLPQHDNSFVCNIRQCTPQKLVLYIHATSYIISANKFVTFPRVFRQLGCMQLITRKFLNINRSYPFRSQCLLQHSKKNSMCSLITFEQGSALDLLGGSKWVSPIDV